jgi:DNA-binding CsgD family transcriptional regulator
VGESDGYLASAAAAVHGMSRLAALAGLIEGELAPARLAHTQSVTRRDPIGLDNASVAFEAMGADLLAAEAAADAAWRQAGDARRGAARERGAATLAERCEGATTPALRAVEACARLTPAEREAALLAAGHSNKEIAGQLSLSVRSVESRLQHVYEKLGVPGRDHLSEFLSKNDRRHPDT